MRLSGYFAFAAFALTALCSHAGASGSSPANLVFFDPASARLTPPTVAILRNISAIYKHVEGPVEILVEGNADSTGPSALNQMLSCNRARAVRDYLIGLGIPRSRFALRAWGEERPLVQTPDETAEQQNRNATIILRERWSVPGGSPDCKKR